MPETPKEIWKYPACKVRKFFLRAESYFSADMPPYTDFGRLLKEVHSKIVDIDSGAQKTGPDELRKNIREMDPRDCEGINHTLFINKDDKYTWRPCKFIHPALYVALAHEVTKKENWDLICERFKKFSQNELIRCFSLPILVSGMQKSKAQQISHWWEKIEQRSIELSLKYNYMIGTDIADCYGSIYTHSIAWAIHSKEEARKKENRQCTLLLGNVIDWYMQDMNQGQTNGIPQGSILTDFIAEIVLGYLDLKLSDKIEEANRIYEAEEQEMIEDYQILRYRDDYRIFVNSKEIGEKITRLLAEVAVDIGFSLKPAKTKVSQEVIQDSIKQDKLGWILRGKDEEELQKQLLVIHDHSRKFPYKGLVNKLLGRYYERIHRVYRFARLNFFRDQQREEGSRESSEMQPRDFRSIVEWNLRKLPKNTKMYRDLSMLGRPLPIISIVVDIGYKNPKSYPVCSAILSALMPFIYDPREKRCILDQIHDKFGELPKNGHLEIWLQRISYLETQHINYREKFCQLVSTEYAPLWEIGWLQDELKHVIGTTNIISREILHSMPPVVSPREISYFAEYPY